MLRLLNKNCLQLSMQHYVKMQENLNILMRTESEVIELSFLLNGQCNKLKC